MPLPKLPNRPAAILTFPSGDTARAKAARTNSKPAVAGNTDEPLLQPELAGLAPARKAPAPAPAPAPAANRPAARPAPARKPRARTDSAARKLFVLDTNVLLHDPSSLFRFEEHDIFLPMMTLEELDHQKKGMSEVAQRAPGQPLARFAGAGCRQPG